MKSAKSLPVGGVAVSFTVTGGGSVAVASATTDGSGTATAGSWTLGNQVGTNTVVATVQGLAPVTFTVNTTAGAPSSITALADNATTATAGQTITPAVRVVDRFGNAVANVPVTFASQAGTLTGASVTTDASGIARVGTWILATTVGTQQISASAGSITAAVSIAVAAAAPTQFVKITGDGQAGLVASVIAARPSVRVTDAYGNVSTGASVTFTVTEGNSVLVGAAQISDANGVATLGGWTLGTISGRNTITASLPSGATSSFTAIGNPGTPTSLAIIAGNTQSATVGAAVATKPAVRARDDFGNGVPAINVTFSAVGSSGTLTGATAATAADGLATVGNWTLGTTAGQNSITASAPGLTPVTFTATGTAGPATQLVKTAGDGQTAQAGTNVAIAPSVTVKDAFGNPVANADVAFAITSSLGGLVSGNAKKSGANGVAAASGWQLGNAGVNTMTASVTGIPTVTFTATATGTAPLTFAKSSGDNSSCAVGATTCQFVARVTSLGAGVAGQTVIWTSGGQTLTTTTNSSGDATANNLIAQSSAGTFTQTATLQSTGASVTFTYLTAVVQPGVFNIDVRFSVPVTPSQQAAFNAAAAHWQNIIIGDVPDVTILASDGVTANICGITHPAVAETVDDILIFVELKDIDGPGKILGQAGPCFYRLSKPMPIIGTMQFDLADLAIMEANGTFLDVITHEMGHVLGIGSMWTASQFPFLLAGGGGSDPFFSGVNAKDYFTRIGGTVAVGNGVPVENCGTGVPSSCGQGTRDSHWRESTFQTELMTGYISPAGTKNPLSSVTIAALADQGYLVNYAAADTYTLPRVSGNMAMEAEGATSLFALSQMTPLNEVPTLPPRMLRHN